MNIWRYNMHSTFMNFPLIPLQISSSFNCHESNRTSRLPNFFMHITLIMSSTWALMKSIPTYQWQTIFTIPFLGAFAPNDECHLRAYLQGWYFIYSSGAYLYSLVYTQSAGSSWPRRFPWSLILRSEHFHNSIADSDTARNVRSLTIIASFVESVGWSLLWWDIILLFVVSLPETGRWDAAITAVEISSTTKVGMLCSC